MARRIYDDPTLYDRVMVPGPCEPFYSDLAGQSGGNVLELACGTGRLTLPISLAGHRITALDISSTMLETAKRKARIQRAEIDFICADMRSFELHRRFALIILSCNSLAHMLTHEDLLSCLSRVKRHLGAKGVFAFDIANPRLDKLVQHPAQKILEFGKGGRGRIAIKESASYDPVRQVRTAQWHVRARTGSTYPLAPLELRIIFPQELLILLQAVGLKLLARYGDFSRSPFGPASSHQICLAG